MTRPPNVLRMETRTALSARTFESAVADLARRQPVEGAMLASRDGLLVANALPSLPAPEVFCAMHAAALGAAEMSLRGIDGRGVSLIAEVGGRRFVSRAISASLFVVALVGMEADCHAVFDWMDRLGEAA